MTTLLTQSLTTTAVVLAAATGGIFGAQPQRARVTVESRVDAKAGVAVVTNLAAVPLTAYLLDVLLEPCGPMQPRTRPLVADAVVSSELWPLRSHESRNEPLGSSPCNKIGAPAPAKAAFRAAIFEDGTSDGDSASVTALVEGRRLALEQSQAIVNRLTASDAAGMAPDALIADLRARTASMLERRSTGLPLPVDLVAAVSSRLTGPPAGRANQIAGVIGELEQLRKRLLDSKPSLR